MEQNKKILVSEWIERAEDDELNVLSILKHRDGTPAFVCFISHQIAEKYLKALLLFYSGDTKKIHSLAKLISFIKSYSPDTTRIENELKLLDPYYIGARYPADIPLESFTWEMAEEAHNITIKIKNFVLEKISEKQKGIFPPQRDPAEGGTTFLVGIIIIVAVAVILFGSVFAWQYLAQKNIPLQILNQQQNQNQPDQTASWKTYTNDNYGFEIKYPSGYIIYDNKEKESTFYTYQVSQILAIKSEKENYIDWSNIRILAGNSSGDLQKCLKNPNFTDSRDIVNTKIINGEKFYTSYEGGDSAMGGARGFVIYNHIVRNNVCYILASEVYWHEVGYGGVINNGVSDATPEQTAGQLKAVQYKKQILNQIISTFNFTK
ncbi:MAG: HEPN domain-containing protein [Patescibacteria group bacterium]